MNNAYAAPEFAVDNYGCSINYYFFSGGAHLQPCVLYRFFGFQHLEMDALTFGNIHRGRFADNVAAGQTGKPCIGGVNHNSKPVLVHHRNRILGGIENGFKHALYFL